MAYRIKRHLEKVLFLIKGIDNATKGEIKMSVLKFLKNEKETLTIKDLMEFFIKEEVCEDYRDQVLSFDRALSVHTTQYTLNKTKETWTLVCESVNNQVIMLFSNTSKVIFFNKSVASHIVLGELIRANNMKRSFFLIDGLFNNTLNAFIGDYTCVESTQFAGITERELFRELNREYTLENKERLIDDEMKKFGVLPMEQVERLMEEWKEAALSTFLYSKQPEEVNYCLKNDYLKVAKEYLTMEVVEKCFNYFNEIEQRLQEMKANPEISVGELERNFKAFMVQDIYRSHVKDWESDMDLLAVREISRLERSGAFNHSGRMLNKPIEIEVVLKGERVKKQAWIHQTAVSYDGLTQKRYSPLGFSLVRYLSNGEFLAYDKIKEVYVDGTCVFSYSEFSDTVQMEKKLQEAKQELELEQAQLLEEQTETKKPNDFKELIEAQIEKVSKRSKVGKGQMALNLFM